ncbi:unnamed protein product, partial [Brenthis ino]
MKRKDSQYSLNRDASRSARMLSDSMSSDEPETESLLNLQQPPIVIAIGSERRQSLTAPPSPTEYRKKRDNRHHHNYINHLHHLIHWRDIWGGETQKPQEDSFDFDEVSCDTSLLTQFTCIQNKDEEEAGEEEQEEDQEEEQEFETYE